MQCNVKTEHPPSVLPKHSVGQSPPLRLDGSAERDTRQQHVCSCQPGNCCVWRSSSGASEALRRVARTYPCE